MCQGCNCGVDFSDPMAECPNKKWGAFSNVTQKYPNTTELIKTFVSAAKNELGAAIAGVPNLSDEEAERRLETCKKCEFFAHEKGRCLKCGCFLRWKTAWRSQKCPIGKWQASA
jgi:hypothetical protein